MRHYLLQIGNDNLYHVISCEIKDKSEDGKYFKVKTHNGAYYQIPSKYVYPTRGMAEDAAFNYNNELRGNRWEFGYIDQTIK